jgi:1-acyl-sn-glycerol-3-phosphate acyltransferase
MQGPGHRARRPAARRPGALIGLAQWILRPLLRLLAPPTWWGTEHLPATGGAVVCANHTGPFDPLAVGHLLQAHHVPPRFMAKQELFDIPVLGTLLRHAGQIPVRRGAGRAGRAIGTAEELVRRGGVVVMFPEGSYTRDAAQWPMRARPGAARIALDTGAPLIPVACVGSRAVWAPRTARLRHRPRGTLVLQVGPPITPRQLPGESDHQATRRTTDEVMAAITAMLAGLRHERPPAHVHDPRQDTFRPEEGPTTPAQGADR